MKEKMVASVNEETMVAKMNLTSVFKGIDKVSEFAAFKKAFSDCAKIGMVWNDKTGEYEAKIALTPESGKVFADYAEEHGIELIIK